MTNARSIVPRPSKGEHSENIKALVYEALLLCSVRDVPTENNLTIPAGWNDVQIWFEIKGEMQTIYPPQANCHFAVAYAQ